MIFWRRNKINKRLEDSTIFKEENVVRIAFNSKVHTKNRIWLYDKKIDYNELKKIFFYRYQVYEWLRPNNVFVKKGQPILIIQLEAPEVYNYVNVRTKVSLPISAPVSGILKYNINLNNDIKDGTFLFSIEENKDEQRKINSDNSYKYFFNRHDLPIEYREYSAKVNDEGKRPFKITKIKDFNIDSYLVKNGSYVEKGTPIIKLKCETLADKIYFFDLRSEFSGYIKFSDVIKIVKLEQNQQLYAVFETKKDKFFKKYNIEYDEFTKDESLVWEVVGGYTKPFNSHTYSPIGGLESITNEGQSLFLSFNNISGRDFLVLYYFSNEMRIKKGNLISFLFETGEIINLKLTDNSIKSNSKWKNLVEARINLTTDELNLFESKKLKAYKITASNFDIKSNKLGNNWYNEEEFKELLQNLAADYLKIVEREIKNYKPLKDREQERESLKADYKGVCSVYLMVDTTNNFYKIGISNKPKYREKTLQSEKPTIELIRSKQYPSRAMAESIEKALHNTFSDKRIRGEWFNLGEEDVNDIIETLE
jgi:hypothetical protein